MMHEGHSQQSELTPEQLKRLLGVVHNMGRNIAPPQSDPLSEQASLDNSSVNVSVTGEPLFVGEICRPIDNKQRFTVSSKFKEELVRQGQSYLTISPTGNLWLFGGQEFRRIYSELHSSATLSDSALELKMFFVRHSREVPIDAQGRITIPKDLCDHVFKEKASPTKLLIYGSGNFIELEPIYEEQK